MRESLQRCVDLLQDLGPRQAPVLVTHREVQLRREHVRVARAASQHAAEELLGGATPVHVRGIDEVDAEREGAIDARQGAVVADPAAEREPGAEADLGDDQVAGAEAAVLHVDLYRSLATALVRARPRPEVDGELGREPVDLGELVGENSSLSSDARFCSSCVDAARPEERRRHPRVAQGPGERHLGERLAPRPRRSRSAPCTLASVSSVSVSGESESSRLARDPSGMPCR